MVVRHWRKLGSASLGGGGGLAILSRGPDERVLLQEACGSTVAGTEVDASVASCGRASLSVAEADVVGPDVVGPQKGDDGAGKALYILV